MLPSLHVQGLAVGKRQCKPIVLHFGFHGLVGKAGLVGSALRLVDIGRLPLFFALACVPLCAICVQV